MKLKVTLAIAGLVALAIPFAASAGSSVDRVTGGGQILVGVGRGGALDTIAFSAFDRAKNRGQVQFVDRSATGQETFHGIVACVEVTSPNTAKIAGTWRNGDGTFQILVVDRGEGFASPDDVVEMQNQAAPTCTHEQNDENPDMALARGNVQVYKAQ